MKNLSAPSTLLFHSFETEVAVYDNLSGALHLLSFLGASLLKAVQKGLEMQELVNEVFIFHDLNMHEASILDIEEAEILVKQFVDTYQNLGLFD